MYEHGGVWLHQPPVIFHQIALLGCRVISPRFTQHFTVLSCSSSVKRQYGVIFIFYLRLLHPCVTWPVTWPVTYPITEWSHLTLIDLQHIEFFIHMASFLPVLWPVCLFSSVADKETHGFPYGWSCVPPADKHFKVSDVISFSYNWAFIVWNHM